MQGHVWSATKRVLLPKDTEEAGRFVLAMGVVFAVLTLSYSCIAPSSVADKLHTLQTMAPVVAVICPTTVYLRLSRRPNVVLWTIFPVLAVPMLLFAELIADIRPIPAQTILIIPALYGVSQLWLAGMIGMVAYSVAGVVVINLGHTPPRVAVIDSVSMATVIVTAAAFLRSAHTRVETLLEQVTEQSLTDSLTGLAARRGLDHAVQSANAEGVQVAFLLIDVDHFKKINDEFGHPAGDDVLRDIAGILIASCRVDDLPCRMGGDEFALLLPGCSQPAAVIRAEQIRAAVAESRFLAALDSSLPVSVSIGVAHTVGPDADLERLYLAADRVLYAAKQNGRDQIGADTAVSGSEQLALAVIESADETGKIRDLAAGPVVQFVEQA